MLTTAIRVRIVVFAVIAVAVIGYIATGYADLGRYVGLRDYFVVKTHLDRTGGLFPGSAVTYRGVEVGKVGAVNLTPTGVVADLRIRNSAPKIPTDLRAAVADRSAVGEQYIDLRPGTTSSPYLRQDSVIAAADTSTPAPVTDTLTSLNAFAATVPLNSLRTVVDELGQAFQGQGPNLQAVLDAGGAFIKAADDNIVPTVGLFENGTTVLATQNAEAKSLKAFARNSALLARRLRDADTDIRKLIAVAPGAATEFSSLLRDLDPGFGVLVANLLSTSRLTATRLPALEELLAKLPAVAAMGKTIVSTGEVNLGLVPTFFNPLPCVTGYGGTIYRNGLDTSTSPPLNASAACTLPPSSGVDVRGSANAPRGGVARAARSSATFRLPGTLALTAVPPGPGGMRQLLGLGATP